MSDDETFGYIYEKPGHLIRRLQQISTSLFYQETKEFDITPVQYAALVAIKLCPGIDQTALANVAALDPSTIADVLARLSSRKLIKRSKGPNDGRTKVLHITANGEQLLGQVELLVERVQKRILEPLAASERAPFLKMMQKLVNLNNEQSRAPRRSRDVRGRSTPRFLAK